MKKYFPAFTFIVFLATIFISCKKSNVTTNNNDVIKLKRIMNGNDTTVLLCSPSCPSVISRNEEEFIYDELNRITQRLITIRRISNVPETIDTMSIFNYSYNDNTAVIYSYSEKTIYSIIKIMHTLSYDSQNRILKDSIINPQPDNNKVTKFIYLQDTIIQLEKQNFIAGEEVKIDTMIMTANNIVKEKIRGFTTRDLLYTVSSHINPLSYVNNFSLLASDLKNGSNSTLFMIYTPQYITLNMTREIEIISSSPYVSTFDITLDPLDRVMSFTNSSNGSKITSFEYY